MTKDVETAIPSDVLYITWSVMPGLDGGKEEGGYC